MGSANINDRSMKGDRDSEVCAVVRDHDKIPGTMDGKPFEVRRFAHELRKRLFREHCGLDEGDNSIRDPLSDECYKGIWLATAHHNTEIFDKVFDGIPKDSIKKLSEVSEEVEVNKKKHFWSKKKKEDNGETTSSQRAENDREEKGLKQQSSSEITQHQNQEELEGVTFGSAPKDDKPDETRQKSVDMLKNVKGHLVYYPLQFLENESLTPGFTNPEAWVSVAVFQ